MSEILVKYLIELDFMDKSSWEPGEWHSEPDKVHWLDNETGLPCLIIRGSHGALNGYVGIPIYHPAYGLSYDGETQHEHDQRHKAFRQALANRDRTKSVFEGLSLENVPENRIIPGIGESILNIEVHGGLTFSGPTQEPTKEQWNKAKKMMPHQIAEAALFPNGDAAEWLKKWESLLVTDNYEKWAIAVKEMSINTCLNDDDEIWWFGFDCAHAGDLCPKIESTLKMIGHQQIKLPDDYTDKYRNLAYVEDECKLLAKQLKGLK